MATTSVVEDDVQKLTAAQLRDVLGKLHVMTTLDEAPLASARKEDLRNTLLDVYQRAAATTTASADDEEGETIVLPLDSRKVARASLRWRRADPSATRAPTPPLSTTATRAPSAAAAAATRATSAPPRRSGARVRIPLRSPPFPARAGARVRIPFRVGVPTAGVAGPSVAVAGGSVRPASQPLDASARHAQGVERCKEVCVRRTTAAETPLCDTVCGEVARVEWGKLLRHALAAPGSAVQLRFLADDTRVSPSPMDRRQWKGLTLSFTPHAVEWEVVYTEPPGGDDDAPDVRRTLHDAARKLADRNPAILAQMRAERNARQHWLIDPTVVYLEGSTRWHAAGVCSQIENCPSMALVRGGSGPGALRAKRINLSANEQAAFLVHCMGSGLFREVQLVSRSRLTRPFTDLLGLQSVERPNYTEPVPRVVVVVPTPAATAWPAPASQATRPESTAAVLGAIAALTSADPPDAWQPYPVVVPRFAENISNISTAQEKAWVAFLQGTRRFVLEAVVAADAYAGGTRPEAVQARLVTAIWRQDAASFATPVLEVRIHVAGNDPSILDAAAAPPPSITAETVRAAFRRRARVLPASVLEAALRAVQAPAATARQRMEEGAALAALGLPAGPYFGNPVEVRTQPWTTANSFREVSAPGAPPDAAARLYGSWMRHARTASAGLLASLPDCPEGPVHSIAPAPQTDWKLVRIVGALQATRFFAGLAASGVFSHIYVSQAAEGADEPAVREEVAAQLRAAGPKGDVAPIVHASPPTAENAAGLHFQRTKPPPPHPYAPARRTSRASATRPSAGAAAGTPAQQPGFLTRMYDLIMTG